MIRRFEVASALGAFVVLSGLACGGRGIKAPQADGQVTTCSYGGKTYNPGDSFLRDCNTCVCGGDGQVACTLILCITDAGGDLAPDAALPDARADVALSLDAAPERDAPQVWDAASGSSVDASSLTADASRACVPAVVGGPCTADQIACVACCTERWTCEGGAWQRGFIGCLPGPFSCGDASCWEGLSYCESSSSDGGPTQYACQTLPTGCWGARCPTCDCLASKGISFSQCKDNTGGSIWTVR